MASATSSSTRTGSASSSGSSFCTRDRSMSSWTRLVSRLASICIRPAKRVIASGSSEASMTASESRESAPTGVLSSWLTLATKSRRTASMRRASVRSSTSSSTRREPSGATRAETARASPRPVPRRGRSSSTCRISPSRRVSRAMWSIGSTASFPPLTSPRAYAAELALTTESLSSSTTAEERSTESTVSTPGGRTASVCRDVRVGRAWSRSLQRNASMAMTPVHNPAIAAAAATAAFTSMHPGYACSPTLSQPSGCLLERSSPRVHHGDSAGSLGVAESDA